MLRRLNDALPDLVLGILVYGLLVELIGVWFVKDPLRYSTGLIIGIALAVGMAIHIAMVIRDAVELYGEHGARNRVIAKSLLRYFTVVVVFFFMVKYNLGNMFSAFLGVLGLKIAAYLAPFTHKVILKLKNEKEVKS